MLSTVARHLVVGGGDSPIVAVPPGVLVEADVEYLLQPGRTERGDLYQPAAPAADGSMLRPAVLVIHGGGWYGGDKGAVREMGVTPPHVAAQYGHTECVEALLAAGADKEAAVEGGFTPPHVAAQYGHMECVNALLAAGADKDAAEMYLEP